MADSGNARNHYVDDAYGVKNARSANEYSKLVVFCWWCLLRAYGWFCSDECRYPVCKGSATRGLGSCDLGDHLFITLVVPSRQSLRLLIQEQMHVSQLLKLICAIFVVSISFLTVLVVGSYRTGNFMAAELPLEGRAVIEAGFAAKLADLGIRSVERASSQELLLIEMKDGTQIRDTGVCAWNDAVEERGGCTIYTPGSGRGYIFDVEAKSLRGDPSPAHWSKEKFLEWFGEDIDRVSQSAAKEKLKAEARASWDVAAQKRTDVEPQSVRGDK